MRLADGSSCCCCYCAVRSYLVEIHPVVNETLGIQIVDKTQPTAEYSPSNVSTIYYVPTGTHPESTSADSAASYWCLYLSSMTCFLRCVCVCAAVSTLVAGPIVFRYTDLSLIFTFTFSAAVQGFNPSTHVAARLFDSLMRCPSDLRLFTVILLCVFSCSHPVFPQAWWSSRPRMQWL